VDAWLEEETNELNTNNNATTDAVDTSVTTKNTVPDSSELTDDSEPVAEPEEDEDEKEAREAMEAAQKIVEAARIKKQQKQQAQAKEKEELIKKAEVARVAKEEEVKKATIAAAAALAAQAEAQAQVEALRKQKEDEEEKHRLKLASDAVLALAEADKKAEAAFLESEQEKRDAATAAAVDMEFEDTEEDITPPEANVAKKSDKRGDTEMKDSVEDEEDGETTDDESDDEDVKQTGPIFLAIKKHNGGDTRLRGKAPTPLLKLMPSPPAETQLLISCMAPCESDARFYRPVDSVSTGIVKLDHTLEEYRTKPELFKKDLKNAKHYPVLWSIQARMTEVEALKCDKVTIPDSFHDQLCFPMFVDKSNPAILFTTTPRFNKELNVILRELAIEHSGQIISSSEWSKNVWHTKKATADGDGRYPILSTRLHAAYLAKEKSKKAKKNKKQTASPVKGKPAAVSAKASTTPSKPALPVVVPAKALVKPGKASVPVPIPAPVAAPKSFQEIMATKKKTVPSVEEKKSVDSDSMDTSEDSHSHNGTVPNGTPSKISLKRKNAEPESSEKDDTVSAGSNKRHKLDLLDQLKDADVRKVLADHIADVTTKIVDAVEVNQQNSQMMIEFMEATFPAQFAKFNKNKPKK